MLYLKRIIPDNQCNNLDNNNNKNHIWKYIYIVKISARIHMIYKFLKYLTIIIIYTLK